MFSVRVLCVLVLAVCIWGGTRSQNPDVVGPPVCDCTDKTLRDLLTTETELRNKLQERVVTLEHQILTLQSLSMLTKGQYASCLEILNEFPKATSGSYTISTSGGLLDVYCDMETNGGGYTFLPDSAIKQGLDDQDVARLVTDPKDALLKILVTDGSQPYTVVKQLPMYSNTPLKISLNSFNGYAEPKNGATLGPYIYLGFLPVSIAADPKFQATQGFRSNDQDIVFTNCNADPNSYFAFFPSNGKTTGLQYSGNTLYQAWRTSARPSNRLLPQRFFHITEMHFGGCGIYAESYSWQDVRGVAIGTR